MKYLITGGAGFVGSHLADALVARGDAVTIIDDLSTGSIDNVAGLRDHPRFRHHFGSMLQKELLAELVDEADAVFHLAAAVGVELIVESSIRTIATNVGCTELVLEMAAKKRKKVLITSTSEVYGKSQDLPFREGADLVLGATTRGRWSYACSKALDEFLALAYWRENRLPTVVVRLFNTVGPRQSGRYGMVLPRFVTRALSGEPLSVHGDGKQSRCFTHVDDAVRALIGLMDADSTVGQVYNIGGTEEVTILELARRVIERTQSASQIIFVPYAIAYEEDFEDMARRVPDISKIERAIGWRPAHSLDQVMDSVVEYQRGLTDHRSERPRAVQPSAAAERPVLTVTPLDVTRLRSDATVGTSDAPTPRPGVTGRWGIFLEDYQPAGNHRRAVPAIHLRALRDGARAASLVPSAGDRSADPEQPPSEAQVDAAKGSLAEYERGRTSRRVERRRVARTA
jgi:UDP-glucose 4-epimerase